MSENTTDNQTTGTDEVSQRRARKQATPKQGPKALSTTQAVLLEIEAERKAQDARWGEQNHAQGGGVDPSKAYPYYENLANSWKRINDERITKSVLGFDGILLEEVYEALAEADPVKRREELVQVAGVAVLMIEAIDRNNLGGEAA